MNMKIIFMTFLGLVFTNGFAEANESIGDYVDELRLEIMKQRSEFNSHPVLTNDERLLNEKELHLIKEGLNKTNTDLLKTKRELIATQQALHKTNIMLLETNAQLMSKDAAIKQVQSEVKTIKEPP